MCNGKNYKLLSQADLQFNEYFDLLTNKMMHYKNKKQLARKIIFEKQKISDLRNKVGLDPLF